MLVWGRGRPRLFLALPLPLPPPPFPPTPLPSQSCCPLLPLHDSLPADSLHLPLPPCALPVSLPPTNLPPSPSSPPFLQLNDTLLAAKTEFRFLIAFILAGFVGVTVNIWYMRRKNYAALCGSCRNLLIQLATFVPFDADNLQLMATRQKLARWVSLAYELAILKARGHMDSDQGYGHLVEVGLLEPAEWECLVNGDRHSTVIFWIQREVMRMGEKGLIHATHVQTCASAIGFMRSQVPVPVPSPSA